MHGIAEGARRAPNLEPSDARAGLLGASLQYRYYVLAIIWVVMLFRFIDLQIIAVLLEPIRTEFSLTDTQLGLLSGTAFAIFYATLGLPIAWLADRYNRRNIIAACLGLWSAMTVCCGFAGSFATLFLARVGVGVGEAGGAPPSYSMISDYFPASRRSTILAFLNSAVPMGVFAGFIIGGYVNSVLGWRAALIVVGAAGVLVALLIRVTVREPARGNADGGAVVAAPPPMPEVLRYLWSLRSYRHLVCATSIATLGAVGSGIWITSFFIRVHEMPPVQATTWLAFIYGGGGIVGAILGGALADRLAKRSADQRWQTWVAAAAIGAILPFSFFVYLWPVATVALLVHSVTTFLMHAWMGPAYGTIQNLAGPNRRATAAAVNLLVVNLLALGMGPLLVGAMSDYFTAQYGANSLRYSILTLVVITYTWAAVHFLLASRTLRQDLQSPPANAGPGLVGGPASRKARRPPQVNVPHTLGSMVTAFMVSRALHAATTLSLPDHLREGPRTSAELASATGTDPESLRRLLNALVAFSVLEERGGLFSLTEMGEQLRSDVPHSMRDFVLYMGSEWQAQMWSGFLDSVRSGKPNPARGMSGSLFEYFERDPAGELFEKSMKTLTGVNAFPIVAACDLNGADRVADVGGGNGTLLAALLSSNPQVTGVLFERSTCIAAAKQYLADKPEAQRCSFQAGDMFSDPLPAADVYILKNVLHDWNDEQAVSILTNCRRAMPRGARLLVIEVVVKPGSMRLDQACMDLSMLLLTGGRERSEAEYRQLLERSGLHVKRLKRSRSAFSIIEAEAA